MPCRRSTSSFYSQKVARSSSIVQQQLRPGTIFMCSGRIVECIAGAQSNIPIPKVLCSLPLLPDFFPPCDAVQGSTMMMMIDCP